jgi:cardiolipin synthase (CMP-forming)
MGTTTPAEGDSTPGVELPPHGSVTSADGGTGRVATIPNLISVVRLCCIPVFLYLLFGRGERFEAALLLAVLGATDWVDGFIARRWHQVSNLGKLLDPTADRLLLFVGVVAILVDGSVPVVVAALTILREGVVLGIAVTLLAARAEPIPVTWFGKAGTFGMMFAYPFFLAGASDVSWAGTATMLGWACVVPGLALGYVAAAGYLRPALVSLRAAKADRELAAGAGGSDGKVPRPG